MIVAEPGLSSALARGGRLLRSREVPSAVCGAFATERPIGI